jgi:hypothetical protein
MSNLSLLRLLGGHSAHVLTFEINLPADMPQALAVSFFNCAVDRLQAWDRRR